MQKFPKSYISKYFILTEECKNMEQWSEINKGMIPAGEYLMRLQYGDYSNLVVILDNDSFEITLNFRGDISFHCVDESKWFLLPYDKEAYDYYWERNFDNIIYRIYNGKYQAFTKKYAGQVFNEEELVHYIIITMNYYLEVITPTPIDVMVKNLKTDECKKYIIEGYQPKTNL